MFFIKTFHFDQGTAMEEKAMPSVWSTKPRVGHAVSYPKPSKKSTNGLGPGGLGFESGHTNPNQQLTIGWTNGKAKNKKHKVPMAMKHVFFFKRIHLFKAIICGEVACGHPSTHNHGSV